jgi:hypothetical protein
MNNGEIQPVFVVGTGRSGSTIFFDIFANHPNVCWPSELSRRFPDHLWLNRALMQLRSWEPVDRILGKRYGPSEAYPFWDRNCPGFSNPYRDLVSADVTPTAAARIRRSVDELLTSRRNRFIAKITGWPRIRYLREIFPRALFVEVTRNPSATVASLLNVDFWDGWRGPPSWRRGPLPPDLEAIWRDEGESFVSLAAIEYVMVQRAMATCRASLPAQQFHTVLYSELCTNPVGVFRKTVEFSRLEWSPQFENAVRRFKLVDRDDSWRHGLSPAQQETLVRTLERAQARPLG